MPSSQPFILSTQPQHGEVGRPTHDSELLHRYLSVKCEYSCENWELSSSLTTISCLFSYLTRSSQVPELGLHLI